jgi:hypothetical protein
MSRIVVPVFTFALMFGISEIALAQFGTNDIPNQTRRRGSTSDVNKLREFEKKAAYETKRAENFASRGVRNTKWSPMVTRINLPRTSSEGNARLAQMNRIWKRASPMARQIINYEFDVISKHTRWLIKKGR